MLALVRPCPRRRRGPVGGLAENSHWGDELAAAGFVDLHGFAFDTAVPFTQILQIPHRIQALIGRPEVQ